MRTMSGLENSTRPLVFTSASGRRASENFDISSENQIFPYMPIVFVMQGKCLFSDISSPAWFCSLLNRQKIRKCLVSGYPTHPNILVPTQTFLKTFWILMSIFRLSLRIFILFQYKKKIFCIKKSLPTYMYRS